jgi:hypothetical protein
MIDRVTVRGLQMRRWWSAGVAMIGALILAVVATTPPNAAGMDEAPSRFSADRAMADVRAIAREPRPSGSAAHAAARNHLVGRLQALGLQVRLQPAALDKGGAETLHKWSRSTRTPSLVNIVATAPGRDASAPAVLLMAHYDSVWGSPGAADDAAGVATILEVVRASRGDVTPARTLIVLLTDGEELGLQGARAFFEQPHPPIGVIVNLETRGGGGRATMFETGADNGGMMALFGRHVRRPVATSLSTFIYQRLPNSTDYTIAKKQGVPGFNYAFIGRPGLYHSPLATPDALDQGALQDLGRQVLDLTRALLAVPALPGAAPDETFFDLFGIGFVSYPESIGWFVLAIALAGYAVAARGRAPLSDIARGGAAMMGLILASAALLYIANGVSGGWGEVNYYDRLAAVPRLQVQALLVCAGTFLLLRRWLRSTTGVIVGAALPLLLLGTVVQALAPTASYPIVVPMMLGGVALAIARVSRPGGLAATIIAAMLGIGYLLGFGFFMHQAIGPTMPMIATLPLAISAVLILPLLPADSPGRPHLLGAVLLVLATAVALWVLLDPIAPSVATYSTTH